VSSLIRGRGAAGDPSWLRAAPAVSDVSVGFDIVMLAGQSNMDGAGTVDPDIDLGDSNIWSFPAQGVDVDTIIEGLDPLLHPSPSSGMYLGPGMPFARQWITLTSSVRKVLLVPCAVGGTGLSGSAWAVGGARYTYAVSHTLAALAAAEALAPGGDHRIIAVLWAQGENDAVRSVSQSSYAAAFDNMMAGFRGALNVPDLPVMIGAMVPEWRTAPNGTSLAIYAAQIDAPDRDDRAVYVEGPGTGYGQDSGLIHWNAAAQRFIGAAMADALHALPPSTPLVIDDPGDPIRSWSLDETTGNFLDSSPDNDPFVLGALGPATRTGNGVDFNTSGTTQITNAGLWLNNLTEFSLAFTVVTTASSGTHALVCRDDSGRPSNNQDRMFWCAMTSSGVVRFQLVVPTTNDVSGVFDSTTLINDGSPHRVVVTVGGGRLRMYVDGALDSVGGYGGGALTTAGNQPLVLGKIDIGTSGFSWAWPLDGTLRDVQFWDGELPADLAEVA
jgi:hypothetical protein